MLQRDYFFEFAGMPQGGKTTIVDIVAHSLKRKGIPIGEYDGGSRGNPLYDSPRADLNLSLACRTVDFVINAIAREKTSHRVFLLDSGLINRYFFTETLLRRGEIDEDQSQSIKKFLTLPHLLKRLDGVFIFITTPQIALERENQHKLTSVPGGVMNESFLSTMYSVIVEGHKKFQSVLQNVHLIDTEQENNQLRKTADFVVSEIENITMEHRVVYSILR